MDVMFNIFPLLSQTGHLKQTQSLSVVRLSIEKQACCLPGYLKSNKTFIISEYPALKPSWRPVSESPFNLSWPRSFHRLSCLSLPRNRLSWLEDCLISELLGILFLFLCLAENIPESDRSSSSSTKSSDLLKLENSPLGLRFGLLINSFALLIELNSPFGFRPRLIGK